MSEWQPIETAPKDGTTVILYRNGDIDTGHYIEDEGLWCWESDNPWEVTHMSMYTDEYMDEGVKPSHWMPLPEPPHPHSSERLNMIKRLPPKK